MLNGLDRGDWVAQVKIIAVICRSLGQETAETTSVTSPDTLPVPNNMRRTLKINESEFLLSRKEQKRIEKLACPDTPNMCLALLVTKASVLSSTSKNHTPTCLRKLAHGADGQCNSKLARIQLFALLLDERFRELDERNSTIE